MNKGKIMTTKTLLVVCVGGANNGKRMWVGKELPALLLPAPYAPNIVETYLPKRFMESGTTIVFYAEKSLTRIQALQILLDNHEELYR